MATGNRQRIFPLTLTPIENFLLTDDHPSYPMAFAIDMYLAGTVDRAAFNDALAKALDRHPLLKCFIRPAKRNVLCWVSSNGRQPYIDWADAGEPIALPGDEWIDLHDETGLRIWIRQGETRARIVIQFHHVCCDGIGAYRFLGDLLAIYGTHTAADDSTRPELGVINTSRLRGRADGCGYLDRAGQPGRQTRESIKLATRVFGQRCDPISPPKPSNSTHEYPGYCCYTFSPEKLKRLRDLARTSFGMLNDLLLLEMFCMIDRWNRSKRKRLFGGKYRIMMPVDLRNTGDYETPASNIIGYSFLAHGASELRDRHRLAKRIREETALIKHDCHAQRFVDMVSAGSNAGGLMSRLLALPRSLASVILSNVGDPSRRFLAKFPRRDGCITCGNLTLEKIAGYPPIRRRTRAAFSIVTYRKELTISLRCDKHLFSMQDTQALLETYVDQLNQCLDHA